MAADPLADPFADPSITATDTNFGSSVSSPGSLSSTNLSLPSSSTSFSALNDPNYFSTGSVNTGSLGSPVPTTGVNTGSGAGVGGGAGGSNTGANIGGLLAGL